MAGPKVHRPRVIARRDCPILLELGEKVLNQMTGFVQFRIVSSLGLAVVARWNHGALPLGIEAVDHSLICIIALVSQQCT